jgi:plastocyanin
MRWTAPALALVIVLAPACGGGGSKQPHAELRKTLPTAEPTSTDIAVTIRPEAATVGAFGPQSLTVKVGERVQWNNWSNDTHSVTFDDPAIGTSPDLPGGGHWEARFPKAGSFTYHCHIHPAMTGTVTVG